MGSYMTKGEGDAATRPGKERGGGGGVNGAVQNLAGQERVHGAAQRQRGGSGR